MYFRQCPPYQWIDRTGPDSGIADKHMFLPDRIRKGRCHGGTTGIMSAYE
jgi:hypothetical protein